MIDIFRNCDIHHIKVESFISYLLFIFYFFLYVLAKEIQRLENIPSDVGSVMSLHNLDSNLLTQVESVSFFCKLDELTFLNISNVYFNSYQ